MTTPSSLKEIKAPVFSSSPQAPSMSVSIRKALKRLKLEKGLANLHYYIKLIDLPLL
jgi:hypothetical protein